MMGTGMIICIAGIIGIIVSVTALICTVRVFARQNKHVLERIEND